MTRTVLYVGGDSFTCGDELLDQPFTPPNVKKDPSWMGDPDRLRNINEQWGDYPTYLAACKQVAWPALLAQQLGHDCVNGAITGNSMLAILHHTQQDLLHLREERPLDTIQVIIQITGWGRSSVFGPDGTTGHIKPINVHAGKAMRDRSDRVRSYLRAWERVEDNAAMHYRWLLLARTIDDVVHSHTGTRPCWVDSRVLCGTGQHVLHTEPHPAQTTRLLKALGGAQWIDPDNTMSRFVQTVNDILPGGHYGQQVHQRFAHHLAHHLAQQYGPTGWEGPQ